MEIGFHYYIIKLLCLGLGLPEPQANIIAYSSQHVDDNLSWRTVDESLPSEFPIVATFSIDQSKKKDDRYPTLLLHFPPGDGPEIPGMERVDGKWFEGITTPGAKMANHALDKAIDNGNLYQIGVSLHTFADTWAHQGFAGCEHHCNKMTGPWNIYHALPQLGHGQAGHHPDQPILWEDRRLKEEHCKINNKERFYKAATAIAEKLDVFINPKSGSEERKERINSVLEKVFKAFGEPIPIVGRKEKELNELASVQIYDFRKLGYEEQFGGKFLEPYHKDRWQEDSIHVKVRGFNDTKFSDFFSGIFSSQLKDVYSWQMSYWESKSLNKSHDNTDMTVKVFDVDPNTRFFKSFPITEVDNEAPEIIKNISRTPYYQFHVAAQTVLSHLVTQTEKRQAIDKKGKSIISLYQYYDEGENEKWVSEMKNRTLARRVHIYGDEN